MLAPAPVGYGMFFELAQPCLSFFFLFSSSFVLADRNSWFFYYLFVLIVKGQRKSELYSPAVRMKKGEKKKKKKKTFCIYKITSIKGTASTSQCSATTSFTSINALHWSSVSDLFRCVCHLCSCERTLLSSHRVARASDECHKQTTIKMHRFIRNRLIDTKQRSSSKAKWVGCSWHETWRKEHDIAWRFIDMCVFKRIFLIHVYMYVCVCVCVIAARLVCVATVVSEWLSRLDACRTRRQHWTRKQHSSFVFSCVHMCCCCYSHHVCWLLYVRVFVCAQGLVHMHSGNEGRYGYSIENSRRTYPTLPMLFATLPGTNIMFLHIIDFFSLFIRSK